MELGGVAARLGGVGARLGTIEVAAPVTPFPGPFPVTAGSAPMGAVVPAGVPSPTPIAVGAFTPPDGAGFGGAVPDAVYPPGSADVTGRAVAAAAPVGRPLAGRPAGRAGPPGGASAPLVVGAALAAVAILAVGDSRRVARAAALPGAGSAP